MQRTRTLIPAAILLLAAGIGTLATGNSHGFENVLSNVFFFALLALALFLVAATARALISAIRTRSTSHTTT